MATSTEIAAALAHLDAARAFIAALPTDDPDPPPPPPMEDTVVIDGPVLVSTLRIMADQTLIFRDGAELIIDDVAPADAEQMETGLIVMGRWVCEGTGPFVIRSANPDGHRGHVMVMGPAALVDIYNIDFKDLGRTRKDIPVTDLPDVNNLRGRYPLHFHLCGLVNTHKVKNCRGARSPGWGFVNHSSHVVFEDCESSDVFGNHFVTEIGDELGAFRRCKALRSVGSGLPVEDSRGNSDWGHSGVGFWIQGGGNVLVEDNYYEDCPFGYVYMGLEPAAVQEENLADQTFWLGNPVYGPGLVPSFDIPIRCFRNRGRQTNGVHSTALVIWGIHTDHYHKTDSQVFDCDFDGRLALGYSGFIHFKNTKFVNLLPDPPWDGSNNSSESISGLTYEDCTFEGWGIGINNPCTGNGSGVGAKETRIIRGVFNNRVNILILNTQTLSDGMTPRERTLIIDGLQQYGPDSEWNIRMAIEFFSWNIRPLEDGVMPEDQWKFLFTDSGPWPGPAISPFDRIMLSGEQVEFAERNPDYPLWPQMKEKYGVATVGELAEQHGLVVGGRPLKPGHTEPKVRGWILS